MRTGAPGTSPISISRSPCAPCRSTEETRAVTSWGIESRVIFVYGPYRCVPWQFEIHFQNHHKGGKQVPGRGSVRINQLKKANFTKRRGGSYSSVCEIPRSRAGYFPNLTGYEHALIELLMQGRTNSDEETVGIGGG